jgi:hypothetical protein
LLLVTVVGVVTVVIAIIAICVVMITTYPTKAKNAIARYRSQRSATGLCVTITQHSTKAKNQGTQQLHVAFLIYQSPHAATLLAMLLPASFQFLPASFQFQFLCFFLLCEAGQTRRKQAEEAKRRRA